MKKCDIKGCKKNAEVFMKNVCFCREHWQKIFRERVLAVVNNHVKIET